MKRVLLFVQLIVLVACQKVIEIDVPIEPPKLTINSLIDSDKMWTIDISKSRSVLDNEFGYDSVTNAVVSITDETFHTSFDLTHKQRFRYESNQKPIPGHTYTLNVSANGFETVTSTTLFPDVVKIKEARWDSTDVTVGPLNFQTCIALYVTFDDPPGVRNNYEIMMYDHRASLFPSKPDTSLSYHQIFHDDPGIANPEGSTDGRLMHAFSDISFDGQEKTIKFLVPLDYYIFRTTLQLANQTGDYSKYYDTRWLQFRAQGDPFAQPSAVYTNIQNGYGIFAGRTFSVVSWDVPKR